MNFQGKTLMFLRLAIILSGLFLLAGGAETQTKIRFGQAAGISSHAPFWVAIEAGFFKKNGIDLETIFIRDAVTTARALLAEEIQMAGSSANATASAILAGADMVIIASAYHRMLGWEIWARPNVNLNNLKGKSIGISRFGATTDLVARRFANEKGFKIEKDFSIREVGGGEVERLNALARGSVDLAILTPPAIHLAPSLGLRKIFDVTELNLLYPRSPTVTTSRFINGHGDDVRKFLRAYIEGIHFFKTNKEYSLKVMAKYLRVENKEILEKDYVLHAKSVESIPYPLPEAIKTVLEELAPRLPKARTANPNDFIDDRFVRELDTSGFIRQLYEK